MAAGRRSDLLSFSLRSGEKVASMKCEPDEGQLRNCKRPLTRLRVAPAPSPRFAGRGKEELLRRLPALPNRGVDLRQHLLGEQLHVAAAAIPVLPVLAGKQQRAEIADLLAERQIGRASCRERV